MAEALKTFSQSSTAFKIGFFGLLFTTLIHLTGFSTVYWLYYEMSSSPSLYSSLQLRIAKSGHQGLWRTCGCTDFGGSELCDCVAIPHELMPSWFKATQAMETLGLIALITAAACTFTTLCAPHQRAIRHLGIIATFLAGICILIGVGIFGAKKNDLFDLHYSFALCCVSGGLSIICALILCTDSGHSRNAAGGAGSLPANGGYVMTTAPPVGQLYGQGQGQGQQIVMTIDQPAYPQAYAQTTQYTPGAYLASTQPPTNRK